MQCVAMTPLLPTALPETPRRADATGTSSIQNFLEHAVCFHKTFLMLIGVAFALSALMSDAD